jgi:hypothetical protein
MMVRITGPVVVFGADKKPVSDARTLQQLNGARADDTCENYLSPSLGDLGVRGGQIHLVYDAADKELRVVTEYEVPGRLSAKDLKQLVKETVGQWSDGIGEGRFNEAVDRLGVCLDLSPSGQANALRVEQVGTAKPKTRNPSAGLPKAAREGDLEKVRALLDAGADLQTVSQGFPVLHSAILAGHADVALELIAHGADIHALDLFHGDPLMSCGTSNQITDEDAARVARALLERGADPHRPRGKPDLAQDTPLYMARNRKKRKLEKVLREFGAEK